MIEGIVESLSVDGVFVGWLHDINDAAPAMVEIRLGTEVSSRNRPAETHHPIHPLDAPSTRALFGGKMLIFMPDSALLY